MAAKKYAWRYTDGQGQHWLLGVKKEIADQLGGGTSTTPLIGGQAATSAMALKSLPNGFRPRGVHVQNAAGIKRFVVCMSPDAPLYTGTLAGGATTATEITLRDALGANSTYFRQTPVGERSERRGVNTVA